MKHAPKLARYEVLGRLAAGGMAEVWLARSVGVAGFEKLVVIKTILPNLAESPQFVSMFVNEARLAAMLSHPNCVQIFDLGQEGTTLYIAMEYLEGFALSRLLKRARTQSVPVSEGLIARIIMDAASGLDYAHRLKDREGRHVGLVHRDVSPNNLMVSARGEVKLLDFGIVKSDQRLTRTQTGVVKGNLYFMSPEQARALEVDARSDLFSLGMVLYSAATGRPLYSGNTSFELINRAGLGPTPEDLKRVAALPPPLAGLVARALEVDPERRYRNADEFARAVAQGGGIGTAAALQALMEALFTDDFGAESARLSATRVTA